MGPKVEKPIKKDRIDTAVKKNEVTCFPVVVSANNVETVVLLLDTVENDILIQILRALSKFAQVSLENVKILYQLNVMKTLWRTISHEDLGICRYSLKLMAQLHDDPDAIALLVNNHEGIALLLDILLKNPEDKFLQEFGASIFSKLSVSLQGCDKLIHTDIIDTAFANLISPDPDVRKNYLQILCNLINDPDGADIISEKVNWEPVLTMMKDNYVDIQKLSIEVINKLVSRHKDIRLQDSFKNAGGILALLSVLESYSLKHLHSFILDVLNTYNETEMSINNFYESGCLTRFIQYLEMAPLEEKQKCFAVFLKMAIHKKGREMLHMCRLEQLICEVLSGTDVTLWGPACQAAALMCRHCNSAALMVEKSIVQQLVTILQNDSVDWVQVKEDATLLLAELFRVEKKACDAFIELQGHLLLRGYLETEKRSEITHKGLENIIQCFLNLENYQDSRNVLLTDEFIHELMNILQNEDMEVNAWICEVLCGMMIDEAAKTAFIANDGVELVRKLLEGETKGVAQIASKLVIMTADNVNTCSYIKEGVLHILLENKKMTAACVLWRRAIETLFHYHLPAKFAITSVLDFIDVTKQDFYVMKCVPKRFPELEEIMEDVMSLEYPVYFSHFSHDSSNESLTKFQFSSLSTINSSTDSDYSVKLSAILDDTHLSLYLRSLKNRSVQECLQMTEPITLVERIQILAECVHDQMCGPDPKLECSNHFIDLHLSQRRAMLGTYFIPLGLIRVGGKLERAILFKVLADKVNIPAKLIRGCKANTWIEVPIFKMPSMGAQIAQELMTDWSNFRSSHVVDLMDKPGRLMPLGSPEAAHYCGLPVDLY